MKIYKDSQLTQEVTTLDFGPVRAGEKQTFTYYILNELDAKLEDIKFENSHNELKVISYPTSLESGESGKLVMEWSPTVTLKQGLKSLLQYRATEIWS